MKARVAALLGLSASLSIAADPSVSGGNSFSLIGKPNGGGGVSGGGTFTLQSAIGEPTAGRLTGGNYRLQGGFIGVLIGETIGGDAVLMVTRNTQGQVVLTWEAAGYALEVRNLLGGVNDWETVDIPPADRRFSTPANLPARFFRLRLR